MSGYPKKASMSMCTLLAIENQKGQAFRSYLLLKLPDIILCPYVLSLRAAHAWRFLVHGDHL